jgi:hypothetical protein
LYSSWELTKGQALPVKAHFSFITIEIASCFLLHLFPFTLLVPGVHREVKVIHSPKPDSEVMTEPHHYIYFDIIPSSSLQQQHTATANQVFENSARRANCSQDVYIPKEEASNERPGRGVHPAEDAQEPAQTEDACSDFRQEQCATSERPA